LRINLHLIKHHRVGCRAPMADRDQDQVQIARVMCANAVMKRTSHVKHGRSVFLIHEIC
jgi:hypothetical protein